MRSCENAPFFKCVSALPPKTRIFFENALKSGVPEKEGR